MPDFVLDHTQQWIDHFAREGHDAQALAAGVEGAIYDLGGGLIAKVWRDRAVVELERLQRFYADAAAAGLPFATPEFIRVQQVDGTSVTCERKLPGEPLQSRLKLDDREISPAVVQCVSNVLRALATVRATGSMRQLAVLDEDQPLWSGAQDFRAALIGLLGRRVARFGDVIRRHLPDFDRRYGALQNCLATLSQCPDTVLHGDLFGGNILVDDEIQPLAVLDFGFLTTAGDPRLDAAITASVMNIYGPHAPSIYPRPGGAPIGRPWLPGRGASDLSGLLRRSDEQCIHARRQRRALRLVHRATPPRRHQRSTRPMNSKRVAADKAASHMAGSGDRWPRLAADCCILALARLILVFVRLGSRPLLATGPR